MNDLQITTITIANNDDLGNGSTKRKIGYSGSFSDGTHTEGFILLNEEDFLKTSFSDLKNTIGDRLVENLISNKIVSELSKGSPSIDSVDTTNDSVTIKSE